MDSAVKAVRSPAAKFHRTSPGRIVGLMSIQHPMKLEAQLADFPAKVKTDVASDEEKEEMRVARLLVRGNPLKWQFTGF